MVSTTRDLRPYGSVPTPPTITAMTTEVRPERTPIVELTTNTTVADARSAMDDVGASLALATDHGSVVGLITRADVDQALADDDEPIGDVMTTELVHIDPATGDLQTLDVYRHAAWASLRRRAPGRPRIGRRHWRRNVDAPR